ncbi:MAG: hypothetical protein KIS92_00165 [Planctomycetota bacterium]|nr:hypothetical protein [Planctomycetota bacterium]
MKALIAPLFGILLGLAVLAALGNAPEPAPVPAVSAEPPGLTELLARGPVCVAWTEMAGDTPMPHEGGLVFYRHENLVYGSAWFLKATYTKAWPLVAGVGTVNNETIYIAFRNATHQEEHEFYHAACVFQYNPVTREFHCEFMQQADPYSGRVPGKARGRLVTRPGPEYDPYVSAIVKKAADKPVVAQFHPCPVLRHNEGKGEYTLYLANEEFHFCCPSCMDVFQANPQIFMPQRREDEAP